MFPSAGLFADISCPLSEGGFCERPHCLYKHGTELQDMFGATFKSSLVDFAGIQNGSPYADCGAPLNDEMKGECNQELERISKEIEAVRHEVEQERRRLTHYRTVQSDGRHTPPYIPPSESVGKDVDGGSSCTDSTKTHPRASKYVLDNSKPRTDLEYDPLSNFSAGLRSHSSSGKEQKAKTGQDMKRARNAAPCAKTKPVACQAQISQVPSPKPLDEDGVLIIDIPPSPDKKRGRVDGRSPQDRDEFNQVPVLLHSPPTSVIEDKANSNCCSERSQGPSNVFGHQKCTDIPADESVVHLTGCLGDLGRASQKITHCQVTKAAAANSQSGEDINQNQPTELPAQDTTGNRQLSTKCVASMLPHSQKTSNKTPGQMCGKGVPPESHMEPAEPFSGDGRGRPLQIPPAASTEHLMDKANKEEVIIIDSSSDNDLNYSDMELSDSDPMEECYRIFMEENEDEGTKQPDVSVGAMDAEEPDLNVKPKALQGKKRVAHVARQAEQPVVKSRPQPQVLVPLRGPAASGFAPQPSGTSKIQQAQERASMLTASVKGGQAFVSSTCLRRPETQTAPAPTVTPENLHPAPVQNAYINCIPLGSAVIEVGNNLHIILPEGAFPLPGTSSSIPITSVLTPVSQAPTRAVAVKQAYHLPAGGSVQRHRTKAPVLIPALARKPSMTTAAASAHASPAASTTPSSTVLAAVKPVATKRKLKQQCEAAKDIVPHDIRQRYVNMFTEEYLKTTANVDDAFEKALAEEKTVFNRSMNKLKYLSVAVNALKRLRNQSAAAAAKDENEASNQKFKGNVPLSLKRFERNDDMALYESLKDYILTEDRLIENNYPVQHPENPGCAVLFVDNKKGNADPLKRICCRCGATYSVSQTGKHIRKEECNYHYGKGVKNRVPGGIETRYSCCEGVMGAPGCQVFKLHVHDFLSLDGFVSTTPRHSSHTSCPGVYSLDCEMCYTNHGLELSRVTLVNSSLRVVYDTFVKPDNEVIDYNTRFSGISEEDVNGHHTSLREVQATLLSFISADTILIGHGLETDLCALKLFHGLVVDTSVVFPHRLGPPYKRTLNRLTAEYLRKIIQESVCGHDTAEVATACMELMLWRVKEDGKLKK